MDLLVHPLAKPLWHGWAQPAHERAARIRCALGRHGCTHAKREGDGKTPYGALPMRRLWYRADRVAARLLPRQLPVEKIAPDHIWSNDGRDPDYNRPGRAPHPFRHEKLWREDHLYDVFVELGWNDSPPSPDKGSAIFLHLTTPDLSPTEGCVALPWRDLQRLLPSLRRGDRVLIAPDAPQTAPRQS